MVKGSCQVIVLHIIFTLYKSCNGNQILTQRRKAAKSNNRGLRLWVRSKLPCQNVCSNSNDFPGLCPFQLTQNFLCFMISHCIII